MIVVCLGRGGTVRVMSVAQLFPRPVTVEFSWLGQTFVLGRRLAAGTLGS